MPSIPASFPIIMQTVGRNFDEILRQVVSFRRRIFKCHRCNRRIWLCFQYLTHMLRAWSLRSPHKPTFHIKVLLEPTGPSIGFSLLGLRYISVPALLLNIELIYAFHGHDGSTYNTAITSPTTWVWIRRQNGQPRVTLSSQVLSLSHVICHSLRIFCRWGISTSLVCPGLKTVRHQQGWNAGVASANQHRLYDGAIGFRTSFDAR